MNLLIEIESQTSGIGHCVIYFKVERIELFEGPSVFIGISIRLDEGLTSHCVTSPEDSADAPTHA